MRFAGARRVGGVWGFGLMRLGGSRLDSWNWTEGGNLERGRACTCDLQVFGDQGLGRRLTAMHGWGSDLWHAGVGLRLR